ncbi:MAG: DUF1178 family protein [Pseudomonadota bacterium]
MIKYTLKCDQGHSFESWFDSAAAYDKVKTAGLVACSICGSTNVEKSLMTPQVSTKPEKTDLKKPISDIEKEIQALRAKVEANSDDVGTKFASEARAMYYGEKPQRSIYGQAKPEETKSLLDEGVPVAPLPWGPKTSAH